MRTYRTHIMLGILLVSLALPVSAVFAAPKPKAVVDSGVFWPALTVFPGTIYDNIYTQQAATMASTGSFTVNQAKSEKYVVVQVDLANLQPSTTYTVYFDRNGIDESRPSGDCSSAGTSWSLMSTVTTDASGAASWYYNTGDLAVGTYVWSMFVNKITYRPGTTKIATNYTILISDNANFIIEP